MAESIFWLKIAAMIGIVVVTIIFAFIPFVVLTTMLGYGKHNRNNIFSYLLCFSGSLIATTGLNHVLMNSMEAFNLYEDGLAYPYAPCICAGTIILSWLVEKLVTNKRDRHQVFSDIYLLEEEDPNPVEPVNITFALYLQSIMEGLVLGATDVQEDNISMYMVLAAIVLQKALEGFALGSILEEHNNYNGLTKVLLLLLFSILTSVGICIGMILTNALSGVAPLIAGICSAISAGVFIYVGFISILSREVQKITSVFHRFLYIALGWLVSSAIAWIA